MNLPPPLASTAELREFVLTCSRRAHIMTFMKGSLAKILILATIVFHVNAAYTAGLDYTSINTASAQLSTQVKSLARFLPTFKSKDAPENVARSTTTPGETGPMMLLSSEMNATAPDAARPSTQSQTFSVITSNPGTLKPVQSVKQR